MAALADIFALARIKLDDGSFQAEALRSADKAGKTAGDKMAGQLNNQLKTKLKATLGAGLALGFAAITKQGLELNETLTETQARSGAVGAEWDAMSASIQKQNRRTTLSLQEIGDGVAALKTDLGVAGDEMDMASDKLTNFGLVAREVFADSVRGADDLKDAFNLTLAEVFVVLDTLVASQQKYGGVITENRAALVALAPALVAANLGWEEGNELINLANASGIEGAAIVTALTKALGKVKSPAELRKLIADIQATPDAFARSEKAIDLFGAKAGPKMALALAPGKGALEDYGLTAEETAGRVDKAADQINSSWNRRIKLAVENVTGFLASIGNATGPVLSIVGSLGSALGGLAAVAPGALSGLLGKLGLARGQSPATPLYTSEVGLGGAAGAAGAGGRFGFLGNALKVTVIGAVAVAGFAAALEASGLLQPNHQLKTNANRFGGKTFRGTNVAEEQIANLERGLVQLDQRAASGDRMAARQAEQQRVEIARLRAAMLSGTPRGVTTDIRTPGIDTLNLAISTGFNLGFKDPLTAMQKQLHEDLQQAIKNLDSDDVHMREALAQVVTAIRGGVGSAKTTDAIIADLKARRDATQQPALIAMYTAAIAKLEPFAKGRQWQAEQIAEARKVVASNMTTAEKVAALKGIQQDLLTHQRTMAAGIVGKQIDTITAIDKLPTTIATALGAGLQGLLRPGGTVNQKEDRGGAASNQNSPNPDRPRTATPQISPNPDRHALGGRFRPREPMIVGELRPELLIPDVGGRIEPRVPDSLAAGNTYNLNVQGLIPYKDPFQIVTEQRRLGSFGVLTPRRAGA